MKYFFNLVFTIFFGMIQVHAQPVNDDCSTARDLGMLPIALDSLCPDGTIYYSMGLADSTIGATPSLPYLSMTNCYGYSNSTTTLADDIWFKFKIPTNSIELRLVSNDTMHMNLYHGTSCGTLQPSGCWTFTNDVFQMDFFTSNDTMNEYNYVQLSGISPGRQFYFAMCIRAMFNFAAPFGTILVGEKENNFSDSNNLLLYPNPVNKVLNFSYPLNFNNFSYNVIDLRGKVVRSGVVESEQVKLDGINSGLYSILIYDPYTDFYRTERFVVR